MSTSESDDDEIPIPKGTYPYYVTYFFNIFRPPPPPLSDHLWYKRGRPSTAVVANTVVKPKAKKLSNGHWAGKVRQPESWAEFG